MNEITNVEAKRSNFDIAKFFLDGYQRDAMTSLYAYCRNVDDAADEMPPAQGRKVLAHWRKWLPSSRMVNHYGIPLKPLAELIKGAQSDMRPRVRFTSQKDLDLYCHRVAGVVGQSCLSIFGVEPGEGIEYAEHLGRALQQINFIRDVAEDTDRNRIYFVLSDLKRCGISEKKWLEKKPGPGGIKLLSLMAGRARQDLARSWELRRQLKYGLRPADIMADVYTRLLDIMEADGFRVFEKRYRVSRWQKAWLVMRRIWHVGP